MVDVINTRVPTIQNVQGAKIRANWKAIKNRLQNVEAKDTFTSTATANVTTTLNINSTGIQEFTGTTTQIVILPDTSTLSAGKSFKFINNSTGVITLKDSDNTTLTTLSANTNATVTCLSIVTQTWEVEQIKPASSFGFNITGYGTTITTGIGIGLERKVTIRQKIIGWQLSNNNTGIIGDVVIQPQVNGGNVMTSEKPTIAAGQSATLTLATPIQLEIGDTVDTNILSCTAFTYLTLTYLTERN